MSKGKKWITSNPDDHITRNEAESLYNNLHSGMEFHAAIGEPAFWEHVNRCRHCGLIWESVCRRGDEERARKERRSYAETFMPIPGFPSE